MSYPSVKSLTEAFGKDKAKLIRAAMESDPTLRDTNRMEVIDSILGTHGVEYIKHGRNYRSPAIVYCNMGNPYDTTILRVRGKFRIGCWGDLVERGKYA